MISFREIIVLIVVTAGLWLVRRIQTQIMTGRSETSAESQRSRHAANDNTNGDFKEMVKCQRCGVHIALEHAIGDNQQGYRCRNAQCVEKADTA